MAKYFIIIYRCYKSAVTMVLLAIDLNKYDNRRNVNMNATVSCYSVQETPLFEQAAALWLESVRYTVKQSTYQQYWRLVTLHIIPAFRGIPAGLLGEDEIIRYIEHGLTKGRLDQAGGLSPKTLRDILTVLKSVLRFLQRRQWTEQTRFDIPLPKLEPKEIEILSEGQQFALETFLNHPDSGLCGLGVLVCLYTGLRIGEICALRWGDIHFESASLKVRQTMLRLSSGENGGTQVILDTPKTASSMREVPLPVCLLSKLYPFRGLYQPDAFFLTGNTLHYVEPRTYQYRFKRYLKQAGLPDMKFHILRHTFATRCIALGFDPKTLSEILGHADVNTTLKRYVHSSLEMKRSQMERLLPLAL